MFTVVFQFVPGTSQTVNLQEPVTIAEALTNLDGVNPGNWTAQIGGREVPMDTQLTDSTGTVRLLKSKVKGNA